MATENTKNLFANAPYKDDFADSDNFHRVLFKSGKPVQARELTQLQTIIQKEIERFARNIFKEGSAVRPAKNSIVSKPQFVRVANTGENVDTLRGKLVTGDTSGVQAYIDDVYNYVDGSNDHQILYVTYTSDGGATPGDTPITFGLTETVTIDGLGSFGVNPGPAPRIGFALKASIDEGEFFALGHFVYVAAQQIYVDYENSDVDEIVGFTVNESIITVDDDNQLYDNSGANLNFTSEGADRYQIRLTMTTLTDHNTVSPEKPFVYLLKINQGKVADINEGDVEYNRILDVMAQRTYEESGDYTVKPFISYFDEVKSADGVALGDSDNYLVLNVEPGIGYVKGYRVAPDAARNGSWTGSSNRILVNRARDIDSADDISVGANYGNYITVNTADSAQGLVFTGNDVDNYSKVRIFKLKPDDPSFGGLEGAPGVSRIGTTFVRDIRPTNNTDEFDMYFFGTEFVDQYSWSDAACIGTARSGDPILSFVTLQPNDQLKFPAENNVFFKLPNPRLALEKDGAPALSLDIDFVHYYTVSLTGGPPRADFTINTSAKGGGSFQDPDDWVYSSTKSSGAYATKPTTDIVFASPPAGNTTATIQPSLMVGNDSADTAHLRTVIRRPNQVCRRKTVTNATANNLVLQQDSNGTGVLLSDKYVNLNQYDIIRINSVTNNGENVTGNFTLDNGQRDNWYQQGKIFLPKANNAASDSAFPTDGTYLVNVDFDYYEHSNAANESFFSAQSYIWAGSPNVEYDDIPTYKSTTGEVYDLRNYLDFRSKKDTSEDDFSGGDAFYSVPPVNASTLDGSYYFYMPRRDRLVVNKSDLETDPFSRNGVLNYLEGVSSYQPTYPVISKDAMHLYDIDLNAGTLDDEDAVLTFIENKRYTMRDIGRLETKIEQNREWVGLSLLELETSAIEVLDNNGLNRTKSGFFVDNFLDNRRQDHRSPEFMASNDLEFGLLRPAFVENHIGLLYDADNSNQIVIGNAFDSDGSDRKLVSEPVLTLPFVEESMFEQLKASNVSNVNPFNIVNNIGILVLDPAQDDWIDQTSIPGVNVAGFVNSRTGSSGFDSLRPLDPTQFITRFNRIDPNWASWDWGFWGRRNLTDAAGRIGAANAATGVYDFLKINDLSYKGGRVYRGTTNTGISVSQFQYDLKRMAVEVQTAPGGRTAQKAYIPWMRSRQVLFRGVGLKPATKHFAFFDGVPVSEWTRGLSSAQYLTKLDSAFGNPSSGIYPTRGRTQHPEGSSQLETDTQGRLFGSFWIPNDRERKRFRSGERELWIADIQTVDPGTATSQASAMYTARGTDESVTETSRTVRLKRYEPLAQTFRNDKTHGIMISSVEVFVSTKGLLGAPGSRSDLVCEIRPVVNGYPSGEERMQFGVSTSKWDDVNVASTDPVSGELVTTSGSSHKFVFDRLIYLEPETEYAIVLLSQSDDYFVYVATMGEYEVGSDQKRITTQPTMGSLFKSQNGATWTASQNQDLTFRINVAKFTESTGTVRFNNEDLPPTRLDTDPFVTTLGDSAVRVIHPMHGYDAGDTVTISRYVSGNAYPAVSGNGILSASDSAASRPAGDEPHYYTGDFQILDVDATGYKVQIPGASPTFSGVTGGDFWQATQNYPMDNLYTSMSILRPSETDAYATAKFTSGKSFAGQETPYVLDTSSSYVSIENNNYFPTHKRICTKERETSQLGGQKSLSFDVVLSRDPSGYLAPLVNMRRATAHAVANIIDFQDSAGGTFRNQPLTYVDETTSTGGSSIAKYISKTVTLENYAVGLQLIVGAYRPSTAEFDVYYKTAFDEVDIAGTDWVKATRDEPVTSDDDGATFREYRYTIGGTEGTLDTFNQFKIKIVMHSYSQTKVPILKDLRVLALAV